MIHVTMETIEEGIKNGLYKTHEQILNNDSQLVTILNKEQTLSLSAGSYAFKAPHDISIIKLTLVSGTIASTDLISYANEEWRCQFNRRQYSFAKELITHHGIFQLNVVGGSDIKLLVSVLPCEEDEEI